MSIKIRFWVQIIHDELRVLDAKLHTRSLNQKKKKNQKFIILTNITVKTKIIFSRQLCLKNNKKKIPYEFSSDQNLN